jgi:hypothetical protein
MQYDRALGVALCAYIATCRGSKKSWVLSGQFYRFRSAKTYSDGRPAQRLIIYWALSLDFHLNKRLGEVMSALGKGSAMNTSLDSFAFQLFPMVFDPGVAALYFFILFDAFYPLIGIMWSYFYTRFYMVQWRAKARRYMAAKDREMDARK